MNSLFQFLKHCRLLLATVFFVSCGDEESDGLRFYCAASQRLVMGEVLALYKARTGERVDVQYGGSGALRAQLDLAGADLFLPADATYLDGLKLSKEEKVSLVELEPVLLLRKGNRDKVTNLHDLKKRKLSLCIGSQSSAIGRATQSLLAESGLSESLMKQVRVERPTVVGVAEMVELGAVDAAIVWRSTAISFARKCDFVEIEGAEDYSAVAMIVACSKDSLRLTRARNFLEFIKHNVEVRQLYESHGYRWVGGVEFHEK